MGKRAEDKLNSLPVERRKFYFKLIFVTLLLAVLLKLIFALADFDKSGAESDRTVSGKTVPADSLDIMKIGLSGIIFSH